MANPNIVSVTSIKGESVGYNLTATTTTTLLTVASDKIVKVNRITCANVDGTNAADLSLSTPIYLMEGDVLKGGASAASDLDLIISYESIDDA